MSKELKILFIEDCLENVSCYMPVIKKALNPKVLELFGDFKSAQQDVHLKAEKGEFYDIVVCDHIFPMFDECTYPRELGHNFQRFIYRIHKRFDRENPYFIHFSSEPKPERYDMRGPFRSIEKGSVDNLFKALIYAKNALRRI